MKLLDRALELVTKYAGHTPYVMGGDNWDTGMDCSAFINRCADRRKFDGKKWWNTDAIHDDAIGKQTIWKPVDEPVDGCIGVYPSSTVLGKKHAGHIWVVENVKTARTIECCKSGNGVCHKVRPSWIKPGAQTNGKKIIWAVLVGE